MDSLPEAWALNRQPPGMGMLGEGGFVDELYRCDRGNFLSHRHFFRGTSFFGLSRSLSRFVPVKWDSQKGLRQRFYGALSHSCPKGCPAKIICPTVPAI